MYGLINNSLREMICSRFGEEKWGQVLAASGVPTDSFLSMQRYDDAITYALADSASQVLGAPVEDCLAMFGEYWVTETASKSYGMLMDAAGSDIIEFLKNLNGLHDRITSTFLDYVPPQFRIEKAGENSHYIHYISQRTGLTAFVVGLLQGLAVRFQCDLVIISQTSRLVEQGEHTVFEVEIGSARASA